MADSANMEKSAADLAEELDAMMLSDAGFFLPVLIEGSIRDCFACSVNSLLNLVTDHLKIIAHQRDCRILPLDFQSPGAGKWIWSIMRRLLISSPG